MLSAGNVKYEFTSIFPPLGKPGWVKMSGLVLTETETDRALWVMFGQEPISLESVCKKIKVVEKADKRCRQSALSDELIPRVTTHWRAANWGQPRGSHCTAGCQPPPSCTHAESSGHVMLQWYKKKKPMQWKPKACLDSNLSGPLAMCQPMCQLPDKQKWLTLKSIKSFQYRRLQLRNKDTDARAKSVEENKILYHGHDEGVWVNQQGTLAWTDLCKVEKS